MDKEKTRFEKIKALSIDGLTEILSFYFGCDRCPAEREGCSDNDAYCMDAIRDWLKQDGDL